MPRVKRGVNALKRRRKVLGQTKGFKIRRKVNERAAKEALLHAGTHAYIDRKDKKANFRGLFQTKIGAFAKENGTSYSKLIGNLHKKGIALDRKILAYLAEKEPKVLSRILEKLA
ncbi:MAG: 50S ribosomal protein L20 [Candidatus Paceibacterota bacterium]|jgi:large subunit ribosomal protein L20